MTKLQYDSRQFNGLAVVVWYYLLGDCGFADRATGLNCAWFQAISTLAAALPALMPTYEYSCQKCGQNFDAFQSMRDEPYRQCPKELCRLPKWGRGKVKRLLGTGAGVIFKGSGFYTTDYRSASYKEAAKKESGSDAGEPKAGAKKEGGGGAKESPKTADGGKAKPESSQ